MHNLYFVVLEKTEGETSVDSRMRAYSTLESEGFNGTQGYFSSSKSDWFSIGGRWTGILKQVEPSLEGVSPAVMESYAHYGDDTDAVIITEETLELLLEKVPYLTDVEVFLADYQEEVMFPELNNDINLRNRLTDTEHWLVVVDYHS